MGGVGPLLVIVNGRPCTGKSYLGARIAEAVGIPLFSKDAFKDTMGRHLGADDRADSRRLGRAAIELMYHAAGAVLSAGSPAMIESPFAPEFAEREVSALQGETGCRILQLFLTATPSVVIERFEARHRDGVHFHEDSLRELEAALHVELQPISIEGETLTIDTTDFERVDYAGLIEFVRESTAGVGR